MTGAKRKCSDLVLRGKVHGVCCSIPLGWLEAVYVISIFLDSSMKLLLLLLL